MAKDKGDGRETFDRDFGYLMPFLDKVQAAAQRLPSPAREELSALLSGERERWTRVRALLGGAPGAAPPPPPRPQPDLRPAPPPGGGAADVRRSASAFTVGPLRRSDG